MLRLENGDGWWVLLAFRFDCAQGWGYWQSDGLSEVGTGSQDLAQSQPITHYAAQGPGGICSIDRFV